MPIDSHLPQADPFSLVPTFKLQVSTLLFNNNFCFRADIQNIMHNVVIYHGNHSVMADQARPVIDR